MRRQNGISTRKWSNLSDVHAKYVAKLLDTIPALNAGNRDSDGAVCLSFTSTRPKNFRKKFPGGELVIPPPNPRAWLDDNPDATPEDFRDICQAIHTVRVIDPSVEFG